MYYLETLPLQQPKEGMADIDELSSDSDDEEYIPEGIQLANSTLSKHLQARAYQKPCLFLFKAHQHYLAMCVKLLTFI